MQVVLVIMSLGLLGLIIYYAVSPKSSKFLRLAALIALGLIVISLVVASLFLVLSDFEESHEETRLPIFLDLPEEPAKKGNIAEIVVFVVFFLFIIGVIVVVSYKDHKKRKEEAKKAGGERIFQHSGEAPDLDVKAEESVEKKEKSKDDFDLGLD